MVSPKGIRREWKSVRTYPVGVRMGAALVDTDDRGEYDYVSIEEEPRHSNLRAGALFFM